MKTLREDITEERTANSIEEKYIQCLEIEQNINLSKPFISVIVPALQEEKIIADSLCCYTNALKKKYNFELIVSDGGSTDKTVDIAKKYADKIVIHTDKKRQTIAGGRNNGARVASGDILVFINADTKPKDPERFFQVINNWAMNRNGFRDAAAIACKVYAAPDEITFKDKLFFSFHNCYVFLLNSMKIGMGRGECQIVKSKVFKDIDGYNSDIVAGEDFDLYRRISKKYPIKYSNELVVYESLRRYRKFGYLPILFSWSLNSLSVIFRGKSISKIWEAVR